MYTIMNFIVNIGQKIFRLALSETEYFLYSMPVLTLFAAIVAVKPGAESR